MRDVEMYFMKKKTTYNQSTQLYDDEQVRPFYKSTYTTFETFD